MQKEKYNYEKYLAQKRFIDVVASINKELLALGVQVPSDSDCYAVDFKKRYECENGQSIRDAELSKIKDIVISERNEFLRKQ